MVEIGAVGQILKQFLAESPREQLEQRLAWHILTGKETLKVDLKWNLSVDPRKNRKVRDKDKIEFAKDVASLANTRSDEEGETGYLLLGVADEKQRQKGQPRDPRFACFDNEGEIEAFNEYLGDIVYPRCDPPVSVSYREIKLGEEKYGLIVVGQSPSWPVYVHYKSRDGKECWEVWIRGGPGGPTKHKAKKREIIVLYLDYFKSLFPDLSEEEWQKQLSQIKKPFLGSRQGAIRFLAASLLDDRDPIRAAAVRGFGEIGGLVEDEKRLVTQLLLGMLVDHDYWVVWETANSLGKIGDKRAVKPLIEHCIYGEQDIPFQAVTAIGNIGDEDDRILLEPFRNDLSLDEQLQDVIAKMLNDLAQKPRQQLEAKRTAEEE